MSMSLSNGKRSFANDSGGLTPEIIRQHVRDRIVRRNTITAAQNHQKFQYPTRRHTHNGHPGTKTWQKYNPESKIHKCLPKSFKERRRTKSIVRLCVGGEEFITTRQTVYKLENSRLATMLEDDEYFNPELGVYFIDRSPEVFRAILDCHRYGQLHLPGHLCGNDLLSELKFWGIPIDRVAKCCINKINVGRSEAEVFANVEDELSNQFEDLLILSFRENGLTRTKMRTYLFLEYPSYSTWASRWSTFFATLIIISTLNVAIMSHELGRQKRSEANYTVDEHLLNLVNTSKWKKLWETDVNQYLYFFDLVLVTLFTLEILFRFITGPDKVIFFRSWINVVDAITIMMYWSKFVLSLIIKAISSHEAKTRLEFAVFLFTELQFLRMFRILKLARNFTGLRVLILVLKNSRHELVTLIVFIIVGMFFFSFIIYVVEIYQQETFQNVPVAFWWSIVTMTTVGYGDHTPHGALGMVVGALCAVSGMIISGLSIPILSSNFNLYYNTLEYQLRVQEERIKELKALEMDIKHAKDISDIGSIISPVGSDVLEELEVRNLEKNHLKNGLTRRSSVEVPDTLNKAGAVPETGDVVYKNLDNIVYCGHGMNTYTYPPTDVAFVSGRHSLRSSTKTVLETSIEEAVVDLDDIASDVTSSQRSPPQSTYGSEPANDVSTINSETPAEPPDGTPAERPDDTGLREIDPEEQEHLDMIDDVISNYEQVNCGDVVMETVFSGDVIESYYCDVVRDTVTSASPPIPAVSQEVFAKDMLEQNQFEPISERREFLI